MFRERPGRQCHSHEEDTSNGHLKSTNPIYCSEIRKASCLCVNGLLVVLVFLFVCLFHSWRYRTIVRIALYHIGGLKNTFKVYSQLIYVIRFMCQESFVNLILKIKIIPSIYRLYTGRKKKSSLGQNKL